MSDSGYRPIGIRRAILLIEMDNGFQHGYDVDVEQAVVELGNPYADDEITCWGPLHQHRIRARRYGKITIEGEFATTIVRAGTFEQGQIEPHRPELSP